MEIRNKVIKKYCYAESFTPLGNIIVPIIITITLFCLTEDVNIIIGFTSILFGFLAWLVIDMSGIIIPPTIVHKKRYTDNEDDLYY